MPTMYPAFERDIPGIEPNDFYGRCLSEASDELDEIADKIEVKSINAFVDSRLMYDNYGEDLFGPDVSGLPDAVDWRPATEGIESSLKLREYIESHTEFHPAKCDRQSLIDDLRNLEQLLVAARDTGVRFAMLVDI